MKIEPFTIAVPEATLDDLRRRLANTRWPDDGAGWEYGTALPYMKDLVDYWQHRYDWRRHEAALNTFAHFRTEVDGVGIHFIHERSRGPDPTPLLLLHGWPDSFYRYHRVIPMLTDPARFGGDPADSSRTGKETPCASWGRNCPQQAPYTFAPRELSYRPMSNKDRR
jgi:hypothetical protein